MNRMGMPDLKSHPRASLKPRPTVRESAPATDPVQAVVDKVMRQMADEKAAESVGDRATVERMLLDQVSGNAR